MGNPQEGTIFVGHTQKSGIFSISELTWKFGIWASPGGLYALGGCDLCGLSLLSGWGTEELFGTAELSAESAVCLADADLPQKKKTANKL